MRLLIVLALFVYACSPSKVVTKENIAIDSTIDGQAISDSIIAPYKSSLDATMNEVIGVADVEMKRIKTEKETLLGNFVSDLTYEYVYEMSLLDTFMFGTPDMCILNFGGLRTSIPKGNITRGLVYELMPFENDVVVLQLSKEEMIQMKRYLASTPQPISRATLTISDSDTIFSVRDTPLEDRDYVVVTSDYLAGGGDHMSFFKGKEFTRLKKLRDVIMDHIEGNPDPMKAEITGRITYGK